MDANISHNYSFLKSLVNFLLLSFIYILNFGRFSNDLLIYGLSDWLGSYHVLENVKHEKNDSNSVAKIANRKIKNLLSCTHLSYISFLFANIL